MTVPLLRLAHAAIAIGFIAGLIGRGMAFRAARRGTTLEAVDALLGLSDRFDTTLVIPGSMLVLLSGAAAAVRGKWPLLGAGSRPTWLLVSVLLVLALIPFIPTVLVPQRKRRHAALLHARTAGRLTAELRAAMEHRAVRRVRTLELAVVAVVLTLLILKPF
jgi:Predicted integral membrane protein (DUF2269)